MELHSTVRKLKSEREQIAILDQRGGKKEGMTHVVRFLVFKFSTIELTCAESPDTSSILA